MMFGFKAYIYFDALTNTSRDRISFPVLSQIFDVLQKFATNHKLIISCNSTLPLFTKIYLSKHSKIPFIVKNNLYELINYEKKQQVQVYLVLLTSTLSLARKVIVIVLKFLYNQYSVIYTDQTISYFYIYLGTYKQVYLFISYGYG